MVWVILPIRIITIIIKGEVIDCEAEKESQG